MASIEGMGMFALRRGGGKPKAHFCGFVEGLKLLPKTKKMCFYAFFDKNFTRQSVISKLGELQA